MGILTTSPDVHGVMRVLIQETKRRVIDATTTEVTEIIEREDFVDILGGRIVIMDHLIDGASILVFGRIAQRIPERIGIQQGIDQALAVGVVCLGGDVSVTDGVIHILKEASLRYKILPLLRQVAKFLLLFRRWGRVEMRQPLLDGLPRQERLE